MRVLAVVLALFVSGCAGNQLKGSYWAELNDGFPALCTAKGVCHAPSKQDQQYFRDSICRAEPSAT